MANYSNPSLGFHTDPTGTHEIGQPSFVNEDDSAVLDPSILEADLMQSSDHSTYRKDSFPNANTIVSPTDSSAWDPPQYPNAFSGEPTNVQNPFPFQQTGDPFSQQPHSSVAMFAHQSQQAWGPNRPSGDCTPTTGIDFVPAPHQTAPANLAHHVPHRTDSVHDMFGHPHPHHNQGFPMNHDAGFIPMAAMQIPHSPHSHADWSVIAEKSAHFATNRGRPATPSLTALDFRSSDGIRKKNGRIDIPLERNIQTIDGLINATKDEATLKELKQQKRLLRNREAALASRQRKKKHTEDLEGEKKGLGTQITQLEMLNKRANEELSRRAEDNAAMLRQLQVQQRAIDSMEEQKRDVILKHAEETSALRRKIRILTEQLEAGPAPSMSAAPSSTGYTDFNAEMEALNMGSHGWDSFAMLNDMPTDADDDLSFGTRHGQIASTPASIAPAHLVNPTRPVVKDEADHEQPVASSLLFLLLLCGAFVVSRPASAQPAELLNISEHLRAAAPTVLNTLLSESPTQVKANQPRAANKEQRSMPPPFASNKVNRAGRLDRLHRSLTSPTRQQEIDHAFSMTTTQYASYTDMDVPVYEAQLFEQGEESVPRRRTLAETLASIEHEHTRNNKAEVYTRSLLLEQIPAEVINQFKDMVRDRRNLDLNDQQNLNDHTHDAHVFKFEIET